jgi:hypothetical protein
MAGTGLVQSKLREYPAPGQFEVFLYGTLHGTVHLDARATECVQGTPTYTANNHGVHRVSPKSVQRLASAVLVPHVLIDDGFHPVVVGIYHNEEWG